MSDALRLLVPAFLSLLGLAFTWRQLKERELRREDVLKWGNEAIASLHTIWLALTLDSGICFPAKAGDLLAGEAIRTSVLVEQGRIFFRNSITDEFGAEKPPAYRGYRPLVLDPLVLGHQVACRAVHASFSEKPQLAVLALSATRTLVSLLQTEVGRSRTAAAITQQGGRGIVLDALLMDGTSNPWSSERLDLPTQGPVRSRFRALRHGIKRSVPSVRG